jgi:predicted ArsR family transcriptional regulator
MNYKEKGLKIRTHILRDLVHHPDDISIHIANIFNITTKTVKNHMKRLKRRTLGFNYKINV